MEARTLKTKFGDIQIIDLNDSLLHKLQSRLTYGFYSFGEDYNGARYGFVVRCGDKEIPCLKQQPVDGSKEFAYRLFSIHSLLILETYCQLMEKGYDSIYYATPYMKEKSDGQLESGIAHFIFPGKDQPEAPYKIYDGALGAGATGLFTKFIELYRSNFDDSFRIPYIGVDVRTRSQLGSIQSGFMLCENTIIFQGSQLREDDVRFEILAKHGIKEVVHAPSHPMTISPDQLKEAKGQ